MAVVCCPAKLYTFVIYLINIQSYSPFQESGNFARRKCKALPVDSYLPPGNGDRRSRSTGMSRVSDGTGAAMSRKRMRQAADSQATVSASRLSQPCPTTNRLPALLISRRVARSLNPTPSQSSTEALILRLGCSMANSLDYPVNGACCSSSRPQRQFPSGVLCGEVHQCPVFGSCG
jgi:hypothetical protein